MSINKVSPYIAFGGNAAQAIQLYEKALGAKVESIMRFGDAPPMGHAIPPEYKDRVMHSLLRVGDFTFAAMDAPPTVPVPTASNVQICLEFDEVPEMTRAFDALAVGGTVRMPLQNAFWGARFGMLTDAFSVQWMFSCTPKKG